ncbi:hypothetical protein ACHWQZ_G017473 [Mnemiopsis leidyi]
MTVGLMIDAAVNCLPYIPDHDKDKLLSALRGADLNQDLSTEDTTDMPGHNMDTELDDIMDQFLEMERELSGMPTTGETDTVKLRKKVPTTNSAAYRMSIMALGNTDEKDLDSLLDDLCNDMDDINSSFNFNDLTTPTTPKAKNQFESTLPAPLSGSSDNLPPPPSIYNKNVGGMPPNPPPPPPTPPIDVMPPPPPQNDDLDSALDDLENDLGLPPPDDGCLGLLPPPLAASANSLLSDTGSLPPPPPAPVSPLPTPPPPCSEEQRIHSRPASLVSEGRPASMTAADQRTSVCTTSSGASSHSTPSSGNNGSMYTMSTTPHSTLSKSSGVSSYLTSSSSELYDSKMSLNSTTTDFRENDYKSDPMNVPIRVPDNEPFLNDPDPSPTTPITPGPKSAKIQRRLTMILKEKEDLTEEEKAAILKKEKLKIALEKLKIASNLKIAMKAYNVNNSSKTIWVEQKQTAWDVCQVLAEKNYYKPGSDWTLVEHITDLQIERDLEDHEIVYDVLNSWSRDSTNKMYFRNNVRKFELFRRPQLYLHPTDTYANVVDLNRECRQVLIDDFFSGTANTRIPSIGLKGVHWLKSGKKSWRKMNFVIRDSGIYYAGKAKNKSQSLPWTCFSRTEENDMFLPSNNKEFRKQHKAPTEYCFLIRTKTNTREQHRSTRCICVENELQFRLWTNALRRLEYGEKLLNNFEKSRDWLEKLSKEQGDDIQRACLSPTLHSNFQFGDDRASIVMPDIGDDAGDIFAARFGAAWNNGENVQIKEAPSLFDINLETDNQGMTMVRLHK